MESFVCKLCGKKIEAYKGSQLDYLVAQHNLAKHKGLKLSERVGKDG